MVKHLENRNLFPLSLPGSAAEKEEGIIRQVDPSLKREERVLVRHYLRLAGMFLNPENAPKRIGTDSAARKEMLQVKEARPDLKKAA